MIKARDLTQQALEKMYVEFMKQDEDYEGTYKDIDIQTFLSGTIIRVYFL